MPCNTCIFSKEYLDTAEFTGQASKARADAALIEAKTRARVMEEDAKLEREIKRRRMEEEVFDNDLRRRKLEQEIQDQAAAREIRAEQHTHMHAMLTLLQQLANIQRPKNS